MRRFRSVAVAAAISVALLLGSRPSSAFDLNVSVTVAPPELPVYEQPAIPDDGYIWTPGYWAWDDSYNDYYWVPGTWVIAPETGYLWTPGYWGWDDGFYRWHGGYWGPQIGFYGGVNYGFGYFGHGYDGGYWDHGAFRYNRAYNNVRNDTRITNVYNKSVVNNITVNRVSFNGGSGGIQAHADQRELAAEHERHVQPVAGQMRQEQVAHGNPDLRASNNHGHPAIAATSRPGEFSGHGVIAAHGAPPISHAVPVHSARTVTSPVSQPAQHAPQQFERAPSPPPQQRVQQQQFERAPSPPPQQHAAPAAPHNEPRNEPEPRREEQRDR